MPVSFNNDIKPLFRPIDVEHMKRYKVVLDDYAFMSDVASDHANARAVLNTLTEKKMPPGGPFWPQDRLDLFAKWMSDGYQP
jgi:hypothetical protein